MTYIEFFDKTAIENICACLANAPERVILIGDKMKLLKAHAQRYQQILAQRGYEVEFICHSVNKNNMGNIVQALSYIVETYEDCVFDLTGGDDLFLVATGIVSERYKDRNIQMHRFNIRNGSIIDCDQDGKTVMENMLPEMSVEENIKVYGGNVIYEDVRPGGTVLWDLSDDFKADIGAMWRICGADVRRWNTQIGVLAAAEDLRFEADGPLTTEVSVAYLTDHLRYGGAKFVYLKGMIDDLRDSGLLLEAQCDAQILRVTYKNEQVKRCLTKAGLILELKIYLTALEAEEADGCLVYYDVMNGVCIDWDGQILADESDHGSKNEIDIMMMHGIVPVFVSCKNGYIDIDELYKLNAVAEKFGGRYAKKVLVATALEKNGQFAAYFRQRAKDMNIRLVEGIQNMTDQELSRVVRSFWRN